MGNLVSLFFSFQIDVFKDPVTDPGKVSKKGDITLVKEAGQFKTVRAEEINQQQVAQKK